MTDYQFEYNGLTFGAGTEYPVNRIEGLFARMVNLMTPDLPREHGGLIGASYEEPRRVVLEFEVHGDQDDGSFMTRRDAVMAAFQPLVDTEASFKFGLPGALTRQISCRPYRGGSMVDVFSEMGQADFLFELRASDPVIYSEAQDQIVLTPFVSSAGLSYPVTYPKSYGSGGSGGGMTITNDGDWYSWPLIVIAGPSSGTLTNPIIEFVTTGTRLALDANGGVSITSGQTLIIDTHPARRSIKFATGASRYGRLSSDSEWTALAPGDNEIRFRASGTVTGATATVSARDAWI